MRRRILPCYVILLTILFVCPVTAQDHDSLDAPLSAEDDDMFSFLSYVNVTSRTLGGRQFWGDVLYFRGYRIQHHVASGHYRLLDPRDIRLASGTENKCREALERIKVEEDLDPMSGRAVILLHGMIRSSKSLSTLRRKLEAQGVTVIGFDYPSTQVPLTECAAYFKRVLASLDGIDQIDMVVHSMGGLLVRTYQQMEGADRDPRLHRLVMLGVPNQGADMATRFHGNLLYQWALGPAGQQLIQGEFIDSLPAPDYEFAIISGIRGTPKGWNPMIPGDDDGTVSLASTRLPGATDFMAVRALHTTMMWQPEITESTLRFLATGTLRASGVRHPIYADDFSDSTEIALPDFSELAEALP